MLTPTVERPTETNKAFEIELHCDKFLIFRKTRLLGFRVTEYTSG